MGVRFCRMTKTVGPSRRTCGTVLRVTRVGSDRSGRGHDAAGGARAQHPVLTGVGAETGGREDPRKAASMETRTELLRALGRSEFTVQEMAERTGVSVEAARGRLSRYLAAQLVERTPYVQQYVDDAGRPGRGRPAHLYRVR